MIASKSALAIIIRINNSATYENILPSTWIVSLKKERDHMHKLFDKQTGISNKPLICKKNIQRQQGLHIVKNIQELPKGYYKQYAICQELLMNPFLVAGHKINIRIYLLIFVNQKHNRIEGYINNEGFIYYAPKKFTKKKLDKEYHITTGYIDRKIYKNNPLSLGDLYIHIEKKYGKEKLTFFKTNVKQLFSTVMHTVNPMLQKNELEEDDSPNRFIIMGCDIAPDIDLEVKLMEINKGPDLNAKDRRDGVIKYNVVKDALAICGILNHKPNTYTKIF